MIKKLCMFLLVGTVCASACLSGCGKESDDNQSETSSEMEGNNEGNTVSPGDVDVDVDGDVATDIDEDMKIFQALFDINNKVVIDIDISEEEMNKIQEDYVRYDDIGGKSQIYRMADKVTITIGEDSYVIEQVGVRLKGNTSREPIKDLETGNLNLTHFRLSFNETFDDPEVYGEDAIVWESEEARQERKDRRFATLKSLETKWDSNYDRTHVREYYVYRMFRENGLFAPNTSLSQMIVHGVNYGVYSIYEPIDKEFLKKNFSKDENDGDLYKCAWTFKPCNYTLQTTYGVEDEDTRKRYNYTLKTNKSTSNHETLINFLNVLNSNTTGQKEIEEILDTKYLAKFMACSYFAGGPDDYRNNYNNHYLYFISGSNQAILIPYDYDRCFGILEGWNPSRSGMTMISPFSEMAEGNRSVQTSPLLCKTIENNGFLLEEYKKQLEAIANSEWMTIENFEKYYKIAKKNYEDVCSPTYNFENAEEVILNFSMEGFADSIEDEEGNLSVEDYITKLMETYRKEMK